MNLGTKGAIKQKGDTTLVFFLNVFNNLCLNIIKVNTNFKVEKKNKKTL